MTVANFKMNQTITLPDGHQLGFAEYGDPKGTPVFFFHGLPGNRLFRHPDEGPTASLGVRLICVDRPGIGLSTFKPKRKLLDWPDDITQLADALGYDTVAVVGLSAGGPYALACALRIPERLANVGVIASAPPMHIKRMRVNMGQLTNMNYFLFRYARPLLYLGGRIYRAYARRNPTSLYELAKEQTPEVDRDIISRPAVWEMMLDSWVENLRVSSRGYALDVVIGMSFWGFKAVEISKEVHLWWGGKDEVFITRGMRYLAEHLPNCQEHIWPDAGHFGWIDKWAEVLGVLK